MASMSCFKIAAIVMASVMPSASAFLDEHDHSLVLLQQRAEMIQTTRVQLDVDAVDTLGGVRLGNSAPLSEQGYQLVAALKNDDEMKAFVHRIVEKEARYVNDVAELNGLLPYYSGSHFVQNLDALKKELRSVPWVVDGAGRNAALTEEGYQNVAKLKNKAHMTAFTRRILDANFKKCVDEGALNGLIPHFDGEVAVQSFAKLEQELLSSPWAILRDSEDGEQAYAPSVPQLSLSAQAGPKEEPEQHEPKDLKSVVPGKPDTGIQGCDEWCTSEVFVKVEANTTVLKNLSSWSMKCGWAHCSVCGACKDPSVLLVDPMQQKGDVSKKVQGVAVDTCEDWCTSDSFEILRQNVTSTKQFSWEMKCDWQNCGGCSECGGAVASEGSVHVRALQQHRSVSKPVRQLNSQRKFQRQRKWRQQRQKRQSQGCDRWCSDDLFVKVQANSTVLKNLSSWGMKCSWAHCGECKACKDPTVLTAQASDHESDVVHHSHSKDKPSCEDWCASEKFQVVKQNVTTTKHFSWEMKCGWQFCGACSKCSKRDSTMNAHGAASKSGKKGLEDPVDDEEEVVETTLVTTVVTTTLATTTLATTTLATTTLATTTLATTTLATTTLATTTVLTTVVTTTMPEVVEAEEEALVKKPKHAGFFSRLFGRSGGEEVAPPKKVKGCDSWCAHEVFVKVEANTTVLKNLSSWEMKCSWAHCGECEACKDPTILAAGSTEKTGHAAGHAHSTNKSSCEDWCASDSFEMVKQNVTTTKHFSWESKCAWYYCGGCSKCSQQHSTMNAIVVASKSAKKGLEDPVEEEEVVETTLATTTTAATTTVVTTTLATTTLATTTLATTTMATTTLATTTLATTTLATTTVLTTVVTTTLPEEPEVVEEALIEETDTLVAEEVESGEQVVDESELSEEEEMVEDTPENSPSQESTELQAQGGSEDEEVAEVQPHETKSDDESVAVQPQDANDDQTSAETQPQDQETNEREEGASEESPETAAVIVDVTPVDSLLEEAGDVAATSEEAAEEEDALKSEAEEDVLANEEKELEQKVFVAEAPVEACDDWCSSEIFVKVEANTTTLKNLSAWSMKCGWAHCSGCSACADPSALVAVPLEQKAENGRGESIAHADSCADWCSVDAFQVVKNNITSNRHFSWETKCDWQNCGRCSKCDEADPGSDKSSQLQQRRLRRRQLHRKQFERKHQADSQRQRHAQRQQQQLRQLKNQLKQQQQQAKMQHDADVKRVQETENNGVLGWLQR